MPGLPPETPWYIVLVIVIVVAIFGVFKAEILLFGATVKQLLAEKESRVLEVEKQTARLLAEKDLRIQEKDKQLEKLGAKVDEMVNSQKEMAYAFAKALEIIEEEAHERRTEKR